MRNQKKKSVNPNSLPRVRPADAKKEKRKYQNSKARRAFSLVELLVLVAITSIILSFTISFKWNNTKVLLNSAQEKNQATHMLWLKRINEPTPELSVWEWEDEHNQCWIMYRSGMVELKP